MTVNDYEGMCEGFNKINTLLKLIINVQLNQMRLYNKEEDTIDEEVLESYIRNIKSQGGINE